MKTDLKNNKLSKRSGFTLIEVILVVVIIGILAGIFMKGLNLSGQTERARVTDAKTTLATLSQAVELYEMYNGDYPSSLDGLLDSSKEGYPFLRMPSIPKDPWGNAYQYSAPGSHKNSFDLSVSGREDLNNWEM